MNVRELSKIMSENGIPYKKDFVNVENEGCIAEYRDVFTDIKGDIEECVRYGVQNGFTPAIKDNIEKLARMMVDICGEKKPKHVKKYVDKREEIKRESKKVMGNSVGLDARNEVVKYVKESIEGAKALKTVNMSDERRRVLDESIKKLETLSTILNDVTDVSTKTALDFANQVLDGVFNWQNDAMALMQGKDSLEMLDKTIESATKWKASHTGIERGLFGKAKNVISEQDFEGIKYFEEGKMYYIAKSRGRMEKMKIIQEKIGERRQKLDEDMAKIGKDEAKLKGLSDKIEALENKGQSLVNKCDNGEISEETLNRELERIEDDIYNVREEMDDLNDQIEESRDFIRSDEEMIKAVEDIVDKVMKQAGDPLQFSLIVEDMNFSSLDNYMRGTLQEEDINNIVNLNKQIDALIKESIEKRRGVLSAYKQSRRSMRETLKTQREADRAEREKEREKRRQEKEKQHPERTQASAADRWRAKRSGQTVNPTPTSQTPVNPVNEEPMAQVFGDLSDK